MSTALTIIEQPIAISAGALQVTTVGPATQSPIDPFESDKEFQIVRPKRKRGRPSAYEVRPEHAAGSQDIRQAFTQDMMDE